MPPKPKALSAGAAHAIRRRRPRLQLGVDVKRGVGEIDIRIGMLAMHAGRQHLVPKRQRGLQQSGGAGGAFEMPDVRLDRAQRHRAGGEMEALSTSAMLCTSTTSPTLVEVPWPSISVAVAGDRPAFCQARSMAEFLADRVGRGDALPLAVARLRRCRAARRRSCRHRARHRPGA